MNWLRDIDLQIELDGVGYREMGLPSRVRGVGFCVRGMGNSTFVSSYILEDSELFNDCSRRYLASEHSSLAKLFAPTIAWTTIFLFSTIKILYLIWRKRVEKSGLANVIPRISRQAGVVVVCFGLVHMSAVAVNDFARMLLPQVDLFNPEMLTILIDSVAGGACMFEDSFAVGGVTRTSRINYDYVRHFAFLQLRCYVISTVYSHCYSRRLYCYISVERAFGM